MGEKQLLALRRDSTCVEGCSRAEGAMASEFVRRLVVGAAGVISGVKPASLFNFVPRRCPPDSHEPHAARKAEREVVLVGARGLGCFGVTLAALDRRGGRTALFAYRANDLARILANPDCAAFLTYMGYDVTGVGGVVGELRRRMAAYYGARDRTAPFPHEVGVLLGYPLADVRGFMSGARETCRGPWKAYGSARAAQARFRRVARCEGRCRERFEQGESLGELLELPVTQFVVGL